MINVTTALNFLKKFLRNQKNTEKRGRIFFCYRRDDGPWAPFALYEHIRRLIPGDDLFLDRHSISIGDYWRERTESALAECDVFLALIGPK